MNWAWATSLDQLWRSPTFPMWLTLAAAIFFALIVLVTLLRAERSVANGALTLITLLAIGVAAAATIRGYSPAGRSTSGETQLPQTAAASLPVLSCIDDMAGETVLTACEKTLFGSPESVAAAVSYAASRMTQLTGYGDVAAANGAMTPELQALRRSVERDRYGFMAYVLTVLNRCQPEQCAAFQSLTDHNQIAANMVEKIYEGSVTRYATSWNAPAPVGAVAALPQSPPTGKPTTAEFPTSASIPPVNIMTPEPALAAAPAAPRPPPTASAPSPQPRAATAPTPAAAKKQTASKQSAPKQRAAEPVQLSPAPGAPSAAPKPTGANE